MNCSETLLSINVSPLLPPSPCLLTSFWRNQAKVRSLRTERRHWHQKTILKIEGLQWCGWAVFCLQLP